MCWQTKSTPAMSSPTTLAAKAARYAVSACTWAVQSTVAMAARGLALPCGYSPREAATSLPPTTSKRCTVPGIWRSTITCRVTARAAA